MARVGFVYHPDFLNHDTGFGHPERPDRLHAVYGRLEDSGLLSRMDSLEPRSAELEQLCRVHAEGHVALIRERCERGMHHMGDEETMISSASFEIARLATGSALTGVDAILEGRSDYVFCAVRPPGHHAEYDRAMGFCLFNNVAVAARYVQDIHGIERILIVDWDVHHGNGTQHIFERDPTVFYFSTHQYPYYPWFSGAADETGVGDGAGKNLNAPMPAGAGDEHHLTAFDELLEPAMDEFRPQFVIVSAGFDAHIDDPLSATRVTEEGFTQMTRRVLDIAAAHADGRLVSVLEGGYDLDGLSSSVEAHVKVLLDG